LVASWATIDGYAGSRARGCPSGRRRHERRVHCSRPPPTRHRLAAQAAIAQDERESAAIAEERARIGGELQDIIAHSVSVMIIQAGGARLLVRSDPERARDSILNVEQTGRETLADLHRLLGMLRKDDDPRALAPQPGLNQLAALIDSIRDTGVECELRAEGEPIDLTPVWRVALEAAVATYSAKKPRRTDIRRASSRSPRCRLPR
jgi:signal transduction histidine kinase